MSRQPHDDLIGNDLAENYRAIFTDPNRALTPKKLAEQAKRQNDPQLAKWATAEADARKAAKKDDTPEPSATEAGEQRAAANAAGENVTPTNATPAGDTADAAESKPRGRRGRTAATKEDAAAERAAAEAVIDDSLDDQLSPPADTEK